MEIHRIAPDCLEVDCEWLKHTNCYARSLLFPVHTNSIQLDSIKCFQFPIGLGIFLMA